MAILYGNETASTVRRSQVYQATHNGEGKSLPYMNRSFISFTYGGKKIEDFDLIATISGDRLDRDGYAPFDDTVSTYDNLDGQYYWGTHYQANQMDFQLSTDGIDQKELDNFLHWFQAGVTRELILAEHPNRAILARVANPPKIELLPFEQKVTVIISSVPHETSTTLYKGEIQLSLIMDEPHWYSIKNILGEKVTKDNREYYDDVWTDVTTNQQVNIVDSPDALKVLYEDGIPLGSMIEDDMLLGNGAYATVGRRDEALIWSISEESEDFLDFEDEGFPGEGYGALIVANDATSGYTAIIAGAQVNVGDEGIRSLAPNTPAYFFYAGTAPAPTILSFTLQPKFNPGNQYIVTPYSSVTGGTPYNIITITSENEQEFRFTTPNIFTSYNKVIKLFIDMINHNPAYTWEDIRKKIRDNVRHPVIRAWANKIIEGITDDTSIAATGDATLLASRMKQLFTNSSGIVQNASFIFNSQTGMAKGTFTYRSVPEINAPDIYSDESWASYGATNLVTATEDVGDMLRSNYIIIRDRNYPTSEGKVEKWQNVDGKRQYSHMIKHDCEVELLNLSILYKNMYL